MKALFLLAVLFAYLWHTDNLRLHVDHADQSVTFNFTWGVK